MPLGKLFVEIIWGVGWRSFLWQRHLCLLGTWGHHSQFGTPESNPRLEGPWRTKQSMVLNLQNFLSVFALKIELTGPSLPWGAFPLRFPVHCGCWDSISLCILPSTPSLTWLLKQKLVIRRYSNRQKWILGSLHGVRIFNFLQYN